MRGRFIPLALTLAVLLAGAVAAAVGAGDVARRIWMVGLVALGAPIVFRTLRGALQGRFATDIVASLRLSAQSRCMNRSRGL